MHEPLFPRGSLIVSCQPHGDNNPVRGPAFMGAMALAAAQAGARAVRVNGPDDVLAAVASGLPVIGINKVPTPGYPVYITPSIPIAAELAEAGAHIIAIDCTHRPRDGEPAAEIISYLDKEFGIPTFADISTLDEGLAAEQMGASYVSTTLAGYTGKVPPGRCAPPDLALVEQLAKRLSVPVVAEGRFNTPQLARAAIDAGAHAVVVGTMITDPREIARGFVAALGR